MKARSLYQAGYATLITVLITGAIGTSVAISLIFMGLETSRVSQDVEKSIRARAVAWACAEEGLLRIYESDEFQGSASFDLEGGTCTYEVLIGSGENRTVRSTAFASNYFARLEISVDAIYPEIHIADYRDVAAF
jgi:hypothetical protein